jgi:hypothetical protein
MNPTNYHDDPTERPPAWASALREALREEDDERYLDLIRETRGNTEASAVITNELARIVYGTARGDRTFAELMMMPVIQHGARSLIEDDHKWQPAHLVIEDALRQWMPPTTRLVMFQSVLGYHHIAAWSPVVIRRHLHSSIPGYRVGRVSVIDQPLDLPPDAPRLGFVRFIASSTTGWLELPPPELARDTALREQCEFAFQASREAQLRFHTPQRAQFALRKGVMAWLTALHDFSPITGWMTSLDPNPDAVRISLRLDVGQDFYLQFVVRAHQISDDGVTAILQHLAGIAPALDRETRGPESFNTRH